MKKPIDTNHLPFLDAALDPAIRASLTVSASVKVPCVCDRCHTSRDCTFFSAYRQWRARGEYVCRSCQAKINGLLGPRGLEKRKETFRARYGVDHYMQSSSHRPAVSNLESYLRTHSHPMHVTESRDKLRMTNLERYGVPYTTVLPQCQSTLTNRQTSQREHEVRAFLESVTQTSWADSWDVIPPKQLDGWSPEHQCAFEYCGLYWHSEACGKTRQTHAEKYQQCLKQDIRLYTIFEDEWINRRAQVEDFLRSQLGVYTHRMGARETVVRALDTREAATVITNWHIQPLQQRPQYAYGAYDNSNTLVAVMTFAKHHRTGSSRVADTLVLNRFACRPGYQIVGGASKLFATACVQFRAMPVQHIITWSDHRWSVGRVYERMGFTCDAHLAPEYSYTDGRRRIAKQACTRAKLKCMPGESERQKATQMGLFRIWDCGKTRWRYALRGH